MTDKIKVGDAIFISRSWDEWKPVSFVVEGFDGKWASGSTGHRSMKARVDRGAWKTEGIGFYASCPVFRSKDAWEKARGSEIVIKAERERTRDLWQEIRNGMRGKACPAGALYEAVHAAGILLGLLEEDAE